MKEMKVSPYTFRDLCVGSLTHQDNTTFNWNSDLCWTHSKHWTSVQYFSMICERIDYQMHRFVS